MVSPAPNPFTSPTCPGRSPQVTSVGSSVYTRHQCLGGYGGYGGVSTTTPPFTLSFHIHTRIPDSKGSPDINVKLEHRNVCLKTRYLFALAFLNSFLIGSLNSLGCRWHTNTSFSLRLSAFIYRGYSYVWQLC